MRVSWPNAKFFLGGAFCVVEAMEGTITGTKVATPLTLFLERLFFG